MYIKVNLQTLLDSLGGPGPMNTRFKEEVSDGIYKATQKFVNTLAQARAAGFLVPDTIHVDSGSISNSSQPAESYDPMYTGRKVK